MNGARRAVAASVHPLEREHAGLINALGRTLADDLAAETAFPEQDRAAADGYAVVASDTEGASQATPRALSVLSESSPHTKSIEPGITLRVGAGQPLPNGADAVAPAKSTYRPIDDPQVLVMAEVKPRANVIPAGSSIPSGKVVIGRGTRIGPGEMALIAEMGLHAVTVTRRPEVAVVTTGTAVVDVVDRLEPGEVRNCARYNLVGMVLESGCDLGRLAHVRDGRIGIEKALHECVSSDATILAVGPGDRHDAAVQALSNLGEVVFERVQMQPGAASAFGLINGRPVFVIASEAALETFEVLVRPGLLGLLGRAVTNRPVVRASLDATLKPEPGCWRYEKALTTCEDGEWLARTLPAGDPCALPNSLVVVPENTEIVKRGASVDAMLLRV